MANDSIKLNAIVNEISHNLAELAILGQDSNFDAPPIITSADLVEMIGQSTGSWQPQSKDVIWFNALKLAIYARHLLEHSAHMLQQMDDEELAQKVKNVVNALDEQFHPGETALRVYGRLLSRERNH